MPVRPLGCRLSHLSAEGVCGEDSEGHSYGSLRELWRRELDGEDGRKGWYQRAASHWQAQEASLDGVLGGHAETNGPDLRESRRFLDLLRRSGDLSGDSLEDGLDLGAGIGRVAVGVLLPVLPRLHLVEPNARLLEEAQRQVLRLREPDQVRFTACGLEQLQLDRARYDLIWAQWVFLYLPDDDLTALLGRCREALRRGGLLCVKENVILEGRWQVDKTDNSIARTDAHYKEIFARANLDVVHEARQTCWPNDVIPVKMYALRPARGEERGRRAAADRGNAPPTSRRAPVKRPASSAPARAALAKRPAARRAPNQRAARRPAGAVR